MKIRKYTPTKLVRAPRCAASFKEGGQCLNRVKNKGDLCPHHSRRPTNLVTGRYASIKRQNIRERIRDLQKFERDANDLTPEVELLRALVIETIESYDTRTEALIAWNETRERGTRPVRIPEIEDVRHVLESVGKMVTRQHEIRNRSSISMADFQAAISLMGLAVAACVNQAIPDALVRDRCLRQIEDAWGNISLDAKKPLRQRALAGQFVEGEVIDAIDQPS